MFAAIYRGFVLPGQESEYIKNWETIASFFINHCGAIGSNLHKSEEGEYIAYSRWPTVEQRDKYWKDKNVPDQITEAIDKLKACLDQSKPIDEINMEILKDFMPRSGAKNG